MTISTAPGTVAADILELVRAEPGELTAEDLAEVLQLSVKQAAATCSRLQSQGLLEEFKYHWVTRRDGKPAVLRTVMSRGCQDEIRTVQSTDLEARIAVALEARPLTATELAAKLGLSIRDGSFRRACAWLEYQALVHSYRARWPVVQGTGEAAAPAACACCRGTGRTVEVVSARPRHTRSVFCTCDAGRQRRDSGGEVASIDCAVCAGGEV
ncbi:MAG: hypothetical protein WC869_08280 [Phycisphaerae bacterium]|jgi:predicted ArsR family transcriptional regulator